MFTELSEIVRSFPRARVLLIGDLILDRYIFGDAERISPEAPVPVLRAIERQERVGGTGNVAACLAALGAKVHCIGAIGPDATGQQLVSLIEAAGADCGGCVVADDRQTTTKTRFVGLAQHRHRQQLMRLDEEYTAPLPKPAAAKLTATVLKAIPDCDVVCLEDYQKGVIDRSLMVAIVEAARAAGRPILVDPASHRPFETYRGATILTPNRTELSTAAGRAFDTPQSVLDHGPACLDEWGVDGLVVTLDRDGAVVVRRDADPVHLPTRPRAVYDNTGAGDAVLAALSAAIAVGADLENATRLANIAGGLEVEKFGCVPISADELLADLRLAGRRRNGKLLRVDDLTAELNLRRDRGEIVVFTNGVFDILHPGHVTYLAEAREQGSLLVVGLNADRSVRQQGKGDDRPINDEQFRATMLGALECVDYVVLFDEVDPLKLIDRVQPDVLVKGADWAGKGVVGRELVEKRGGRVSLVPVVEGYSTTSILQRIRYGRST
ncbi:MAG: D-glycero-beta-D-manno-heptose 1-phosphate adenylyltransferase [Phycisphaerales bacterium]|nr:D-glycero-beta-D-manno-heptose 1-phosphate adenylyltransferase [Phycisphaerales bacterium]